MEYIIYHSKDLDGKSSAAIFYNNQTMYGENAKLFPYDYGEKLDTRLFKGKNTVMVDVSMEMDRMELLGKSAIEFTWIDHHISAFDKLIAYCNEKDYKIVERKINDLITSYTVLDMNMTYYYSSVLSACEICIKLFPGNMGNKVFELISALGQYDTWRNTEEKKMFNDKNWITEVIPIQYAMRAFSNIEDLSKKFKKINQGFETINDIINYGEYCFNYQKYKSFNECKSKSGEYIFEGLKVIAINSLDNSSLTFEGFYFKELHQAMVVYSFNAKTNMWDFSLYKTNENKDVDILSIAKKYNGGGHENACGFSIPFDSLHISKNEILIKEKLLINVELLPEEFVENLSNQEILKKIYEIPIQLINSKEEKDIVIKGTKQVQDHEEKWYYVPNILLPAFNDLSLKYSISITEEESKDFHNRFSKYLNENGEKNKPCNHWKK